MRYVVCDRCGGRVTEGRWYRVTMVREHPTEPGEVMEGRTRDVCATCYFSGAPTTTEER